MQACAQQIMATIPCNMAQPCARKAPVAYSSTQIVARINRPSNALTQGLVARPFGAAFGLPSRVSCLQPVQAAQAQMGKLISKVEIPAFIPRTYLVDQLYRWATIEVQENGMANVGCPCKVCVR